MIILFDKSYGFPNKYVSADRRYINLKVTWYKGTNAFNAGIFYLKKAPWLRYLVIGLILIDITLRFNGFETKKDINAMNKKP